MIHVRRIVYPTDFSSYSNQAYFHAISLAEKHGASLSIVYVYNPDGDAQQSNGTTANRDHWREQLESVRPLNPRIEVSHVLLEGDPADEIIRYARDVSADLVVMGTHGRTGRDLLLMGSVAEKVLREAACSVLVVKIPRAAR